MKRLVFIIALFPIMMFSYDNISQKALFNIEGEYVSEKGYKLIIKDGKLDDSGLGLVKYNVDYREKEVMFTIERTGGGFGLYIKQDKKTKEITAQYKELNKQYYNENKQNKEPIIYKKIVDYEPYVSRYARW